MHDERIIPFRSFAYLSSEQMFYVSWKVKWNNYKFCFTLLRLEAI